MGGGLTFRTVQLPFSCTKQRATKERSEEASGSGPRPAGTGRGQGNEKGALAILCHAGPCTSAVRVLRAQGHRKQVCALLLHLEDSPPQTANVLGFEV